MASDLRNKLIRLAHANPEIRKDILPLVKQSNWATKSRMTSLDGATEVWWLKLAEALLNEGYSLLIEKVSSQGIDFSSFGVNGVPARFYAVNGFIYVDIEGVPAAGTETQKKVPVGTTSKSDHKSIVKTFKKIRF